MGEPSPFFPSEVVAALAAAEEESQANVDSAVQFCGPEENWTETGLIDEATGKPVPNIPYKIYDAGSGEQLVSGTLDDQGLSPRHCIPLNNTDLFVIFGTDAAAEEAMTEMKEQARVTKSAHGPVNGGKVRYVKPENKKADRIDRRLAENQTGISEVVLHPPELSFLLK